MFGILYTIITLVAAPSAIGSPPVPKNLHSRQAASESGTGPYPAIYTHDSALPQLTVYQPKDLTSIKDRIPIVIWDENPSETANAKFQNLCLELASWGNMVIASNESSMALAFVTAMAGMGNYEKADVSRLAIAGTSCKRLEMYSVAQDRRVESIALFDSGSQESSADAAVSVDAIANVTASVFFFSNGAVGTENESGMERDYNSVASGVPAWMGMLPGTDTETYAEGGAGKLGRAAQMWVRLVMNSNQDASEYFNDAGAEVEGWTVQSKSLQALASE